MRNILTQLIATALVLTGCTKSDDLPPELTPPEALTTNPPGPNTRAPAAMAPVAPVELLPGELMPGDLGPWATAQAMALPKVQLGARRSVAPVAPVEHPGLQADSMAVFALVQGQLVPVTQVVLMDTLEVVVKTQWRGKAGTYSPRVEFFAPSGDKYQDLTSPVTIGPSGEATSEVRMGVAGTQIQNYGLTGQWTVRAHASDSAEAASVSFGVNR